MAKWIICDLDGTLINTGDLYLGARDKFAKFVNIYFEISYDDVLKIQNDIDAALFRERGYCAERFEDSFAMAINGLKPNKEFVGILDRNECEKRVRDIAKSVFNQDPKEIPGAKSFLRKALERGFKLGLITAGEKWVQRKRITNSGFEHLFHDTWIVKDKDTLVFQDFLNKHRINRCDASMIGDSLRADIIPSAATGINAFFVPNKSTWTTIETETLVLPRNAQQLKCLDDIFLYLEK